MGVVCASCGEGIPAKRLAAVPRATQCVPCLEAAGDVTTYKRIDSYTADGDRVEVVFVASDTHTRELQRQNMPRGLSMLEDDIDVEAVAVLGDFLDDADISRLN